MLSLRECLEGYKHWEPLTGGKTNGKSTRKYSMDLDKHDTTLHAKIESIMMPVITSILKIHHPQFQWDCTKVGALKTLAGSGSQFDDHGQKLHSDYPDHLLRIPVNEQPMSVILAIDDFEFLYLPDRTLTYDNIERKTVRRGEAAIFTNTCLHSGGENPGDMDAYRLFAYLTSFAADLPDKTVTLYDWDHRRHVKESHTSACPQRARLRARSYAQAKEGFSTYENKTTATNKMAGSTDSNDGSPRDEREGSEAKEGAATSENRTEQQNNVRN